jgi:heat shock protein HslJ
MNKSIYIILLLITLGVLGYTTFYVVTHEAPTVTTNETGATTTPLLPGVTLTTISQKTIHIAETNPNGESLSVITITPSGFGTNEILTLEKNKLTTFFLSDINRDGFDELILITTSQGSGSYGQLDIFTTAGDQKLVKVSVPDITEELTTPGGIFEGYMGHDAFSTTTGGIIREFPVYTSTNTNSMPTGPTKRILYELVEKDGAYSLSVKQPSSTTPGVTSTSSPSTSSLQGTSWLWVSSTEKGTVTTNKTPTKFILKFGANTMMESSTDCNGVGGSYALSSSKGIAFSNFISTMMFCEGAQESTYTAHLLKVTSYTVTGKTLTFVLGNNEGTMTFTKQ